MDKPHGKWMLETRKGYYGSTEERCLIWTGDRGVDAVSLQRRFESESLSRILRNKELARTRGKGPSRMMERTFQVKGIVQVCR